MVRAPKAKEAGGSSCSRGWLVLLIMGIVVALGASLWWISSGPPRGAAANDAPSAAPAPAERAEALRPCPPARPCPSPSRPHTCPPPVQCPGPEPAPACTEPEPAPTCPAPAVCHTPAAAVPGVASAEISDADAMQGLQHFGALLRKHTHWERRQSGGHERPVVPKLCKIVSVGVGYGMHEACEIPQEKRNKCVFYSVGIEADYTFDKDLVDKYGCKGFALDPSVVHPSILTPNVIFMSIGSTLLTKHQEGADDWQGKALPPVRRLLRRG